jgi:hypothetical protein
VRDTTLGGDGNIIFCLKVPRQCPLVLLIGVRFYFKVIEVGEAALERNLDRHWEGEISMLPLGGLHGKHAVQRGIGVPTQNLLWDHGKP